jgi:hypothetical protein
MHLLLALGPVGIERFEKQPLLGTEAGVKAAPAEPCLAEQVMERGAFIPDSPDGSACNLLGMPNLVAVSSAYTSR